MAKVKILVEGYTTANTAEQGEEKTCPTITLIRDKDIVMVVDPGVLEDQKILIDKLKEENLTIDDVNIVCITHSHIDHYRNIGIFPKAKTLEYWGLWDRNTVEDWKEQFTDDIQILKTPGHNYDGLTLFVKTDEGVVAICGDIFWEQNFPEDDPYASDIEQLKESRKKVLEMADYIIPGHGKMFKTEK
ncbi:MAG: MBL fold metallo-hydrolase [Patescibacteria group bacterium]|jgi:glyoxylase-like metal-dependent hydrolase (beta-lactamase superfamily II)|nr:MBL fold metallo-hydrolase [Patescibacteria group bacterium]